MKKIIPPQTIRKISRSITLTMSLFLLACLTAQPSLSASEKSGGSKSTFRIANINEIAKNLRLDRFQGRTSQRKVKIAILDQGFYGHETEIGKSLPQNTRYWKGKESDADKVVNESNHGMPMAQILYKILQQSGVKIEFEFHLFRVAGYTKFVDAIDNVIEQKMDIVLHSQVWEYGGNSDGQGFINAQVSRAIQAGVLWISAAGNFERKTHLAPIELDGDWVLTQERNSGKKSIDGVRLRCKPINASSGCPLRMILSWNDFKNDVLMGTDKDLDLYLISSSGKEVAKGELLQKLQTSSGERETSLYPREHIELIIPAGDYRARIKAKSKNLSAARDIFRLTVGGAGVEMIDYHEGESLLPPADHPSAIVIGASDDIFSSKSVKLGKPDVLLRSRVIFSENVFAYSSSTSAAMATAVASLVMAIESDSKRETILARLKEISQKPMTETEIANELKKSTQASSRAASQGHTRTSRTVQSPRPRARLGEEVDPGEPQDDRLGETAAGEPFEQERRATRRNDPFDDEPRSMPNPRDLRDRQPRLGAEIPPPLDHRRLRPIEPRMERPCAQIRALPYFHQGARLVFRRSAEMGRPARSVQLADGQVALVANIGVIRSLGVESAGSEIPFATENGIEMLPEQLFNSPPRSAYPILPEQAVRICP